MTNYYILFEIPYGDINLEELKIQYKQKAKYLHPDKGGKTEEFIELKKGYDILSNPKEKQIYDLQLAQHKVENELIPTCKVSYRYLNKTYFVMNPEVTGIGINKSPLIQNTYTKYIFGKYTFIIPKS